MKFSKEIRNAGTVIMNGPAGVFEREAFTLGTVELIDAATKSGFSVIGGGHSAAVVERLFNLFWINWSWQKRLTAEDAENRRSAEINSYSPVGANPTRGKASHHL